MVAADFSERCAKDPKQTTSALAARSSHWLDHSRKSHATAFLIVKFGWPAASIETVAVPGPQQLEGPDAQDVAVNRWHPLQRPALRMLGKEFIDPVLVRMHTPDQVSGVVRERHGQEWMLGEEHGGVITSNTQHPTLNIQWGQAPGAAVTEC